MISPTWVATDRKTLGKDPWERIRSEAQQGDRYLPGKYPENDESVERPVCETVCHWLAPLFF
jgi:hypothetical protein